MPTSPPFSRPSRPIATLVALLLGVAGVLFAAAPASAHDQLLSSDPAAGSALAELPTQVTLTYSAEILAEPGATLVQVWDAAGADVAEGDPVVSGATVTQALAPGATGAISVLWKVVSSDGHPIDGEFAFTVDGPTASPTPTDAVSPSPEGATAATSPAPAGQASDAPAADSGEGADAVWIPLVLVVALVIAALVWFFAARRRTRARGASSGSAGAQ